jgi:hypothetical protein
MSIYMIPNSCYRIDALLLKRQAESDRPPDGLSSFLREWWTYAADEFGTILEYKEFQAKLLEWMDEHGER